jgi:acetyl-CoA carboxylase carboxyl transferase subunit alpha
MKIIDEIIPEPEGGAHTDHDAAAALVDQVLHRHYEALKAMPARELVDARYDKFRRMAHFFTE